MKKNITQIIALITGAVLTLAVSAGEIAGQAVSQAVFPQITAQPLDQDVGVGFNVVFTAQATNGDLTYQWFHDGKSLDGQTNSDLALQNVGINDAGYYSCTITKDSTEDSAESVPTRAASLSVYTALGSDFVVFGAPSGNGGSQGSCPGTYAGYVTYTKTVSQGWGWAPSTNATVYTASDGGGRTNTSVVYNGKSLDWGCNLTTVTIPYPAVSAKYRFGIYFPNNVPTTNYPIILRGFNQ